MSSTRNSGAPGRYKPAWWLPNAHLQTLWAPLLRRPRRVETRRDRWTMSDGDVLALDRLAGPRGAPKLILLHGLEGSSQSPYVRGMLAGARNLGWSADVLVFRGCGGELNTARRFYHSGETSDLDEVVRRLRSEDQRAPFVFAGFSLGGNVLLKWLGERGLRADAVAAAAVSVPYDLERGARHIHTGFARVYERNFLVSLKRKAAVKRRLFPDLPSDDELSAMRSIFDFDDRVTAPVHGFRDATDYYSRSSALGFLPSIGTHTLLLSARDDPFLPHDVLDQVDRVAGSNDKLHPEFVSRGGHVGFVEGAFPWTARYYAERRALEFLASGVTAFRTRMGADTLSRPLNEENGDG